MKKFPMSLDVALSIIGELRMKKIIELDETPEERSKEELEKEFSLLTTEEKIANGLLHFDVSEDVRLSVMDKIERLYAPQLKAYYTQGEEIPPMFVVGKNGEYPWEMFPWFDVALDIIGELRMMKIDEIANETSEDKKAELRNELSMLTTEEKIANGLLHFDVSENVRLSVMDKIKRLYAPQLKAYYATQ